MFLSILLIVIILYIASQIIYIALSGQAIPRPTIPRTTELFGTGKNISFVVMGDSTSIGQGSSSYDKSIAYLSARHLAQKYTVHLTNIGVSGATTKDALESQLDQAIQLQPDVILIALGANDITHSASLEQSARNMKTIVTRIQQSYPAAHIVLTGSPDMGSISRFPWLIKKVASWRTKRLNRALQRLADERGCQRLRIAEETGPIFSQKPELFAQDKFHPVDAGYALWMPLIYKALDSVV